MQQISYQFATGYERIWLASWQAAMKYMAATTSAVGVYTLSATTIEVEDSQNKQASGQRFRAGR